MMTRVLKFLPTVLLKNWNGLTPMGHHEPDPHWNIIDQTHMEDIQWSGMVATDMVSLHQNQIGTVLVEIWWRVLK
jgi:hypothetical protein